MARSQLGTAPSRAADAARKADLRYDLSGFATGKPAAAEVLMDFLAPVAFTLPAAFAGSVAVATTGPSAAVTLSVTRNGTQIGTINFASGATTATFTASSAVSVVVNDRLRLIAPSSQDANLSDLAWTFAGTR